MEGEQPVIILKTTCGRCCMGRILSCDVCRRLFFRGCFCGFSVSVDADHQSSVWKPTARGSILRNTHLIQSIISIRNSIFCKCWSTRCFDLSGHIVVVTVTVMFVMFLIFTRIEGFFYYSLALKYYSTNQSMNDVILCC